MRLKKLVLSGFKSFADKTTLHFDAGITCIVGPNGCGKSNISDAFRWVLGEQSAKSMRGSKMPDVIFAGANSRKPLNVAEVSLTLTDIQGKLPVDYEEVTLTRRLHRNGESEYLLNGNQVRLKDLQSLFLDSGVGRNAFSIFEQGKLDQVINYTPYDRRYIFEEAAGILRFLQRKREALKRLEQADLNLSRVKDIHQEVEKQITVLKDQAEKAKKFKENKDLLDVLEKASFVLRWNYLEKKWVDAESRKQKQENLLNQFNEDLKKAQGQSQQLKTTLQQEEKSLRTKCEELFKIRNEKEIHTREQQSLHQRLQEAQQKEKKIKREIEELKLSQNSRKKSIADIQLKRKKIETEFLEAESGFSSHQDRIKSKEKEVSELRNELQIKQQNHLKNLPNESQLSSECKQLETRLENNSDRLKILGERKTGLSDEEKRIQQQITEKKKHLSDISALIDTHKDRLEQYEEDLKIVSKDLENKQREMDGLQRKILELQARQKVLLRLRDDHEGFSSGSKKLLQETQKPESLLYNKIRPLYEFLEPDQQSAEAISIILRHYAQTLVVQTQEDLKKVFDFCQKQNVQDYSLICVELINSAESANGVFVKRISQNSLSKHLLQNVSEVKNHDEVIELLKKTSSQEIWNNQGLFVDFKNVFFNVKPNENQVFLRETELRNLEEELSKKEDQLEGLNKQHRSILDQKAKLQSGRTELDTILRRDEMKLVEVNFGVQRSVADQEKVKGEKGQIEKDCQTLGQQIEQQQVDFKKIQDKHFSVKQELSSLHHDTTHMEKELEKQVNVLRIQQQDQKEKGELYQQLSKDRQQLVHQLNVYEMQEQEHGKQEQHFIDELEDLEEIQASIKTSSPHFHEAFEKIEMRLSQASGECSELEKKIDAYKETLEKNEKEIGTVLDLCRKAENEFNQWSLQEAQHRSAAQALEHELQERYELSLIEARTQVVMDKSLEQVEKQLRSLRAFLQNAGDINMAAIEELEKHESRHSFLKQQVDDMSISKDELLQIITQMDLESRKLFKETFEIVRENFKKNFQILFNGGEADLQFTDSENILEAGIEIIAKPPGKQMRSISLMSGGEKCLTAVALLFAVFEYKPAPFCILDEIDAPLDDTNVERFTNVVKHFMHKCQFLIITHNKRTMAIGNMIFGVSMEEKGVSKLLSLEFSNEEAPEASMVEK